MANEILSYEEVLALLSQQARDGSVTAAAALERALRARGEARDDVHQVIGRILEGEAGGEPLRPRTAASPSVLAQPGGFDGPFRSVKVCWTQRAPAGYASDGPIR
jgi:hypothetical protein